MYVNAAVPFMEDTYFSLVIDMASEDLLLSFMVLHYIHIKYPHFMTYSVSEYVYLSIRGKLPEKTGHCHSLLHWASGNKLYQNFQSGEIYCLCSCLVLNKTSA
jgi:hypothetical protein